MLAIYCRERLEALGEMKKFFLCLLGFVFLAAVGIGVFLATFNADHYKEALAKRLEKMTGKPVAIGRLHLGWENGLVLRAVDVSIGQIHVENAGARLKLSTLFRKKIEISSISIRSSGNFVRVDDFSFDSEKKTVFLKNGKIVLSGFGPPVNQIEAEVILSAEKIRLNRLTGKVAGGTLDFSGDITVADSQPLVEMKGSFENVSLDELVKSENSGAVRLGGHVTLAFDGRARGFDWENISRSLSGRARMIVKDGVLLNFNLLREVMDKLSAIPGAGEAIRAHLPEAYRARLEDGSTLLKPLDLTAVITNGIFYLDPIQVETDFVLAYGAGQVGLDRSVNVRANLILEEGLSQVCVRAMSIIQVLCNNRGQMVIPVTVRGQIPGLKIIPDKQYLTSKLLSAKTQEVLQGLVSDPGNGLDKIQDVLKKNLKGLNF